MSKTSKGKILGSIKNSSKESGTPAPVSQSQQLALPKATLDEFSQAVDMTTDKFEKLLKTSDELIQRSAQNPGESARTQDSVNKQIEEQGFNMVEAIFNKMGG